MRDADAFLNTLLALRRNTATIQSFAVKSNTIHNDVHAKKLLRFTSAAVYPFKVHSMFHPSGGDLADLRGVLFFDFGAVVNQNFRV